MLPTSETVVETKWRVSYEQRDAWDVSRHDMFFHLREEAEIFAASIERYRDRSRLLGLTQVACIRHWGRYYNLGAAVCVHPEDLPPEDEMKGPSAQ